MLGVLLIIFGMVSGAFAQEARQPATAAPLAFKVDWVRPRSQEDTKIRYTPVQENIADPNVEMKFYGTAAKQRSPQCDASLGQNPWSDSPMPMGRAKQDANGVNYGRGTITTTSTN